ncbi:MAG: response regulator [Spirochaetaceae bacterium]
MKYTLLIADDEQMEREALRLIVNRESEHIGAIYDAANGREAVEKALAFSPDIVLLDIKMPGMNGVDAAMRILDKRPRTRIVFLTAYNYFDYAQQAIRLGVLDFIVKPATDDRILEAINRVVSDLEEYSVHGSKHTLTERRLVQAQCALEESLVISLVRGDQDASHVHDQIGALDLENRRCIAFALFFDFSSYPMGVDTDAQRLVLRRRCLNELKTRLRLFFDRFLMTHHDETAHVLAVLPERSTTAHDNADSTYGAGVDIAALETAVSDIRRIVGIQCFLGSDLVPRVLEQSGSGIQNAIFARGTARKHQRSVEIFDLHPPEERTPRPQAEVPYERASELDISRLIGALYDADQEQVGLVARRWFVNTSRREPDAQTVRRRVAELFVILAHEFEMDPQKILHDDRAVMDRIDMSADTSELERAMTDGIHALRQAVDRSVKREPVHHQIELARQYIDEHYHKQLALDDVAARVRLSPYYFSRVFKSYTGSNFVDYLNTRRIAAAKRMLRKGGLSVKEIAHSVGFTDPNYFAKVFKHHAHLTPSAYRNKIFPYSQDRTD